MKNLKTARKLRKLTQEEFSAKINTTQEVVSRWERGISEPSVSSIIKICRELRVSADFVLGLTDILKSNKEKE